MTKSSLFFWTHKNWIIVASWFHISMKNIDKANCTRKLLRIFSATDGVQTVNKVTNPSHALLLNENLEQVRSGHVQATSSRSNVALSAACHTQYHKIRYASKFQQ